jgi:hypothetical protein
MKETSYSIGVNKQSGRNTISISNIFSFGEIPPCPIKNV